MRPPSLSRQMSWSIATLAKHNATIVIAHMKARSERAEINFYLNQRILMSLSAC